MIMYCMIMYCRHSMIMYCRHSMIMYCMIMYCHHSMIMYCMMLNNLPGTLRMSSTPLAHLNVQNVLVVNRLPKNLRAKALDYLLGLPNILSMQWPHHQVRAKGSAMQLDLPSGKVVGIRQGLLHGLPMNHLADLDGNPFRPQCGRWR